MQRRLLYLLCFLLISTGILSQETRKYAFTHYGTGGGLASNEIIRLAQDDRGFIWIATNSGLQRFDGTRYLTFRHAAEDPKSIPNNVVVNILFDKKKNLWVQTIDGHVGIFNVNTFSYREIPLLARDSIPYSLSRGLVQDEDGNMFLLVDGRRLFSYNARAALFSEKENFIGKPDNMVVSDLTHQRGTKKYWLSGDAGFVVYNKATGQLSTPENNVERENILEDLKNFRNAFGMFFDKQDRFWFITWPASSGSGILYCYDLKKRQLLLNNFVTADLTGGYNEIRGMLEQQDGSIWLNGLYLFGRFNEKEKAFQLVYNGYLSEQSIEYERVNQLLEDREHNIWVATNNNGLYRFNPAEQFFTNVSYNNRKTKKPGQGSTMSFVQLRNGNILAGAWGDGVYRFTSDLKELPLNIKGFSDMFNPSMWDMVASRDSNTIWMASQPGIWRYDQNTNTATFSDPKIMKSKTVRQIEEDKNGNLWMGSQSAGLFKWTKAKGQKNFEDGMSRFTKVPVTLVTDVMVDSKQKVWVSTPANGVYVIDPDNDSVLHHFTSKGAAASPNFKDGNNSILQYDDTTFVLAGTAINIYNSKTNSFSQIEIPESLSPYIAAVERDSLGYLWISFADGICRVSLKTRVFIHFDRIDGIANDRFTVAASAHLKDGRLFFGCSNQFIVFNPEDVKIDVAAPKITITGFNVMNRSLRVDSLLKLKKIKLPADQNSVIIEFSALSYNSIYIIKHKLEGIDNDWQTSGTLNQAVYSYLPHGTYTLWLSSEDSEGRTSAEPTMVIIEIEPHFWQSWWFYGLLVLLGAGIWYWVDRTRMEKKEALMGMRVQIARELHKEINTTLSNIGLLSEMAKIKADKDVNRSKEYIDQIHDKSRRMVIAMDDILWSIRPENDNMENSLLRMQEFIDALKHRHNAEIEMVVEDRVRTLSPDMKHRHEFFVIFKAALRAIIQFAGGTSTLINIDYTKNRLMLKLKDETTNLDKESEDIEALLQEMQSRAESIDAELDVQSGRGGVAMILFAPIK